MAAAIGELGVAEAKLKDAQQQLVEKREALAGQLDRVDAFAASEHSSAQSLGSAASAVRKQLQENTASSGLSRNSGAAGALLVGLGAVRDKMDAADADSQLRGFLACMLGGVHAVHQEVRPRSVVSSTHRYYWNRG